MDAIEDAHLTDPQVDVWPTDPASQLQTLVNVAW